MSYANTHVGDSGSSAPSAPLMRTVLSEFCEAFESELRPILDPVQHAAEALAAAPEDIAARRVLPTLRDLRHQMEALIGKVAEQQAYVLIFGPIKSGKSTFMNALSAAYVSEVTCLPAYPCMVYVSHSNTPGFVVTHYDGRTASFTHREALREIVADGHHKLTRRIREVEAAGEVFDPAVHMPDAIRKVDIKINVPDLAQSGAVLVDTPGLYTRMKFGYDRMTRDFRNAAACAIFIVKTDNLFLEQVFDEFNELLQLFSRIFLVVNLDSGKKDLLPDGTLAPSLEHESPWEIIEAFETLSMTAPLKEAAEDGRLGIYPVDLLRAASRRIATRTEAGNGSGAEAEQPRGEADFDMLLEDLTDYLNSNEYLKAFLEDSLRRSRTLMDELKAALRDDTVQHLGRDVVALRTGRDEANAQAETVDRLRKASWSERVHGIAPSLLERVGELARQIKAETAGSINSTIERWFESSSSLHDLLENELLPIFASAQSRLVGDTEDALKRRVTEGFADVPEDENLIADLKTLDIDMQSTAEAALGGLKAGAAVSSPRPRLDSEQIPVRRNVSDWLLFRSASMVRRRLFGPDDQPSAELSATVKERRLGDAAREALRDAAMAQLESMVDKVAVDLPDELVRGYAERFEQEIQGRLEAAESQARQRLEEIEKRLSDAEQANERLQALSAKLQSAATSVDALIERFGRTDPATLTQQAV
ncbi:MAG TPA: dynamin family protein [Gammaproteobacteria bacterium]